jgi:hypothetical protein
MEVGKFSKFSPPDPQLSHRAKPHRWHLSSLPAGINLPEQAGHPPRSVSFNSPLLAVLFGKKAKVFKLGSPRAACDHLYTGQTNTGWIARQLFFSKVRSFSLKFTKDAGKRPFFSK